VLLSNRCALLAVCYYDTAAVRTTGACM